MCIIIVKQNGRNVPQEVLKTSAVNNPHGLGVVWLDTFEVSYHKSKKYAVLFTDRPYIAHFRYATIGKKSKKNIHPFVCGNNTDELLMMNGTINGYGSRTMTDTQEIAIELGNISRYKWKKSLSKFDARFVSVNKRNKSFQIYNKELFTSKDGVWYSQENVIQNNLVAVYGTLKKGYSNYYSYLTKATHVGRGLTQDRYPLVVQGLPYLLEKKGYGENVCVDVFRVSDETLKCLDELEGHPNWYIRKRIPINVNGETINAWLYFNPCEEGMWDGSNHVQSYEQNVFTPIYTFEDNTQWSSKDQLIVNGSQAYSIEDEKPYCVECYHELNYDGFANYHCNGCDGWFTETEVASFHR